MPYSLHSHSGQFCKHGYGLLEDVVKEAIRKGFYVYGLTEHMPRFADSELYPEEIEAKCTPSSLATTYNDFLKEAKRLQEVYNGQIQLIIGSEIEFINEEYAKYVHQLRKDTIDYVVGSLHHVQSIPVDFSPELYQKALQIAGNGDLKTLFVKYFNEQYEMLRSVRPEVVGHFDLIRIFSDPVKAEQLLTPSSTEAAEDKEEHNDVWDCIIRNIKYVIEYGGLFEINSRAWKKGLRDAYPHRNIIKAILVEGGRLTLSDDCHGPNDVGLFYEKLPDYLKENQINSIYYLKRDQNIDALSVKEHSNILDDKFWQSMSK
ncbi:Polymerase/histidinol phosphatase-like protein [Mycotypha africana]|uniref:Polymerase/histidinol phosphatase-like protein n=1 Tax=Mycotypha africana TaxID=64632 RepID=UPI00230004F8|nr:Polymerase/histidinol phosphatase-like protein [Mycotypha africana]KAI8969971.1 Polymerase/histidinol phosphatase-like protein [Mycotypha africana]